jgi:hypothetical protein
MTITTDGHEVQLPYCSSHRLRKIDTSVTRAIIVIHGSDRNATRAYDTMTAAAQMVARTSSTLVIAPQFLTEADVLRHRLPVDVLHWQPLPGGQDWEQGWGEGNESGTEPGVSSFAVLDALLEQLVGSGVFPNLRVVVVAGLSGGGSFVHRFAAGSGVEQVLREKYGIRVRYVVGATGHYLYFNRERRVKGTPDAFAIPSNDTQRWCPNWNRYCYGLEGLNPYMAAVGEERIRTQYADRDVVYLIGGEDTEPVNCAAGLLGENRVESTEVYYSYLQHLYGSGITRTQRLAIVPGLGHTYGIFTSRCGLQYLFDLAESGGCGNS